LAAALAGAARLLLLLLTGLLAAALLLLTGLRLLTGLIALLLLTRVLVGILIHDVCLSNGWFEIFFDGPPAQCLRQRVAAPLVPHRCQRQSRRNPSVVIGVPPRN
jgi:hypothetical protein